MSSTGCRPFGGPLVALGGLLVLISLFPASTSVAAEERASRLSGQWELHPSLTATLSGQSFPPMTLILASDPKRSEEPPPALQEVVDRGAFLEAGTLTLGSTTGKYGVFALQGQRLLAFAQPGVEAPQISRLWLIEARARENDLLVLADTATGQVLALARRAVDSVPVLSHLSQALLDVALQGEVFEEAQQARELLAQRPDWEAVIARLMAAIRADPTAPHNNRCLTLHTLVQAHAEVVRLDLGPLLAALRSPSWTNQQKCAYVLEPISSREDLLDGHLDEALIALIRMVPSQRGRVVDAALGLLQALTERSLGRDPEAWRDWYEEHTGKSLHFRGAVHEVLVVIRPGEDGSFQVGGESVDTLAEVVARTQAIEEATPLPISVVIHLGDPASMTSSAASSLPVSAQALIEALQPLGYPITVAPATDTFYPPYPRAYPPY